MFRRKKSKIPEYVTEHDFRIRNDDYTKLLRRLENRVEKLELDNSLYKLARNLKATQWSRIDEELYLTIFGIRFVGVLNKGKYYITRL